MGPGICRKCRGCMKPEKNGLCLIGLPVCICGRVADAPVPSSRRIYLIGSMKNAAIVDIEMELRAAGHQVFADWINPGPEADDFWQGYAQQRGQSYREAIDSPHAQNVFDFDQRWLNWADTAVLVLPAGRSAHLEAGWMAGQGKPVIALFTEEPERYDIMYKLLTGFAFSMDDLKEMLR